MNDIGNLNAPPGSRDWCVAASLQIQSMVRDARSKVGNLRGSLKLFRDNAYYKTLEAKNDALFQTWEQFCLDPPPWGLGMDPEVTDAILNEPDSEKLVATVARKPNDKFDLSFIDADTVTKLQKMISEGGRSAFETVPLLVISVLDNRLWEHRTKQNGDRFASFEDFVTTPFWFGLNSTVEELLVFCRKHDKAQEAIKREISAAGPAEGGRPQGSGKQDNIRDTKGYGTSAAHALRRLKRDNPELAEQVVTGKLSAHAAAVQAGFRRPKIQIAADDAETAAKTMVRLLGPDLAGDVAEHIAALLKK